MEKIKDFLYDISDIVISILIIAGIFVVVSWKISDSMSIASIPVDNLPDTTQSETVVGTSSDVDSVIGEENPIQVITVEESSSEGSSTESGSSSDSMDSTAKPVESKPSEPDTSQVFNDDREITVDIKAGSSPRKMGEALRDAGLISDVDAFVMRAIELKLDSKLRAGKFTLKYSMSMDDMIRKIAGK